MNSKLSMCALCAVLALSSLGLTVDSAKQKLPEIVKDPSLLMDVVFEIDGKENKTEFLEFVRVAVSKYPSHPDEAETLRKDIQFYSFCSTNRIPQLPKNSLEPPYGIYNTGVGFWWGRPRHHRHIHEFDGCIEPEGYGGQEVGGRRWRRHPKRRAGFDVALRHFYFIIRYYKERDKNKEDDEDIEKFFGGYPDKEDDHPKHGEKEQWGDTEYEAELFVTYKEALIYFNALNEVMKPFCHILLYEYNVRDAYDPGLWIPLFEFKNEGLVIK